MVVKINISISKEILDKLDEFAHEHNMSRSGFLSQAAMRIIQEESDKKTLSRRLEAVKSMRNIAKSIGPWDGTAEVLKWRNMH